MDLGLHNVVARISATENKAIIGAECSSGGWYSRERYESLADDSQRLARSINRTLLCRHTPDGDTRSPPAISTVYANAKEERLAASGHGPCCMQSDDE